MAYRDYKAPIIGDAPPPPYSEASAPTGVYSPPSPSTLSEAPRTPPESLSPTPEPQPAAEKKGPVDAKRPMPPAAAQRALAPLSVSQKNSSIRNDYLLFLQSGTTHESVEVKGPDALLQTTNSTIEATVWIADSQWQRRVVVNAKTTNASCNLIVHTQKAGQAVDIYAKTTNSKNNLLLPKHFHGILRMSTTNSKCVLSESLQKSSVRIPCGREEKRSGAEWYEIGGPNGPSVAEIRSSNSRVAAGFVGDNTSYIGTEGSCCCM